MRTIIIIQARIGSTRLPQKVLNPLCGKPMLWHIVQRCRQVAGASEVVVATSQDEADLKIVEFCKGYGINCFTGDLDDVLLRFVGAARAYHADVIVRVTGDNPLIEPDFIEGALTLLLQKKLDYVGVAKCPLGTGTEVFTMQALSIADSQGKEYYHREHVTPYLYENKDIFTTGQYLPEIIFHRPELRLTVDEEMDYRLMQHIYDRLYSENQIVSLAKVIELLDKESDLLLLNQTVKQKQYKD